MFCLLQEVEVKNRGREREWMQPATSTVVEYQLTAGGPTQGRFSIISFSSSSLMAQRERERLSACLPACHQVLYA